MAMRNGLRFLLVVCVFSVEGKHSAAAQAGSSRGGEPVGQSPDASRTEPHKSREQSEDRKFTSSELDRLELLVGAWKVEETHYDRRGNVAATVKGLEEVRWILDGHAIHREYQTETGSGLYRAIGTLTYNAAAREYRGVWFDNVSKAGPTYVRGEWQADSRTMVFTLDALGENGKTATYRIVEQYPDADRRVTTTYLLRDADIVKRMQVDYVRAVPCPARIRGVWGELTGGKRD